MKKAFIIAGAATFLFACNNNENNNKHNNDASHAAHEGMDSLAKNEDQSNPIIATMDKMMQQMHGATLSGNNDIDFAAMMVDHHKAAVEMSEVQIEKGKNAELKDFARKIKDDQNKEIRFMEDFILKAAKTKSSDAETFQQAMNQSMVAMMNDKTTVYNDIDKDFAAQMIPHHQGAVDMAKAYLDLGKEKTLRTLCENIIRSQTTEINWLKSWLDKNKN